MRIAIIGLGGIGTVLQPLLVRFLHSRIKLLNEQYTLTLIDGDSYEPKNADRQAFQEFGNKAQVKEIEIKKEIADVLPVTSIPQYLNPENIAICLETQDVVFLCVDNHKTRKLVSDFASTIPGMVLISGGNELTDGNVQVYIRENNTNVTPSLTRYHPEIENPQDKRPDEMDCFEHAISHPQILFTNATIAVMMLNAFYSWFEKKLDYSEAYTDIIVGKTNPIRRKP